MKRTKLQYKYNTSWGESRVQVGYKLYRDGELGIMEDVVQLVTGELFVAVF